MSKFKDLFIVVSIGVVLIVAVLIVEVLIVVVVFALYHHETKAYLDDHEHPWFTFASFAPILLFCDVLRSMITIANEPDKPRIRFHAPRVQYRLSTALVIVIVAGAMLALNMTPAVYTDEFGPNYTYGWPIGAHWWESMHLTSTWWAKGLIVDGTIAVIIVYFAARLWQRITTGKIAEPPGPERLS